MLLIRLLLAICLSVIFGTATPETPLGAAQLRQHCMAYRQEPRSGPGLFCAAYIRGFLDGAAAIDGRIRDNLRDVSIPSRREQTLINAQDGRPPYCVDASITIDRIIVQVLAYASERADADKVTAYELVDATLRQFHGCPATAAG